MEAEFFIHGPRHAFYGSAEEWQYCQLFDNSQIKDEIRFVVEIHKASNGKRCAYYNYCRYVNVLDIDGRSGAYIGLTVRLDAYYANLRSMFTVLESVFTSRVVGLLLKKIPSGYQYVVADFKNTYQSILTRVEKNLGSLLMGIISDNEVYPIDDSFTYGSKEIIKGIDDNYFSLARLSDIKKSGRLVFASSKVIDLVEEMQSEFEHNKMALNDEKEKALAQLKNSLVELKDVETSLKNDAVNKNERIAHLEKEISELKKDKYSLEKILKERDERINQLEVSKYKKHVRDSSRHLIARQTEERPFSGHQKQEKRRRVDSFFSERGYSMRGIVVMIIFFLFVIAVILLGLFLFSIYGYGKNDKDIIETNASPIMEKPKSLADKYNCIPNKLIERVYPDGAHDKITLTRSKLDSNRINIFLAEPSIPINSYEWIVKDSRSDIKYHETTSIDSISFRLDDGSDYNVFVYVNDTLIVMKSIP